MSEKIIIKDQETPIEISFAEVEKYHGQGAIAGAAIAFKVLHAAMAQLFPGGGAKREEVSITSGHPGPGFRDAFELVTRAVTRGAYTVDRTRPKGRLNPYSDLSYSFDVEVSDGRRAEVVLKEGILPRRFFDLMDAISRGEASEEERRLELPTLKRTIAAQILPRPASELFLVEVIHADA